MKLCFIDTETTGLNACIHEVWEVGMVVRDRPGPDYTDLEQEHDQHETEYVWQLPVDLTLADPIALNIGRFHDRRWSDTSYSKAGHINLLSDEIDDIMAGNRQPATKIIVPEDLMRRWCRNFVEITRGAHLIGNVTSFDEERLRRLLLKHGQVPMWHYHIVCVENLIAGALRLPPPWKSKELSEAIGVPVPVDQHSALVDARWAKDMYDAVYELQIEGYAADVRRGLLAAREDNET